ncbi:hypothetical protein [Enterococcus sp. 5H]|uniref:hypothetical protein n=1 Tax=Enterococcus sp. 5H TaxID=1229490 RepID=UPI00230430C8|nr:hypothetical protein [Enterococcus sp. 5H]
MKKKGTILIIAISIVVIVGIGGKYFMDERSKEKEKELIEIERQSIVALKNTFSDIKEVIIDKTGHNQTTGSYRMFVKMKDLKGNEVSFTYGYWKEREELGDIGIENPEVQVNGITESKVRVIFSDGTEGEV